MEDNLSDDVRSECSEGSSVDRGDSPVDDGPAPSRSGETILASDESDYSGVTNEDDEEDDEEWPPKGEEDEVLSVKQEEFIVEQEVYFDEELAAEEPPTVKEEALSSASDTDFKGFDEPPAKRRRGSVGWNVNGERDDGCGLATARQGVRIQQPGDEHVGGNETVKVESLDWDASFVETFLTLSAATLRKTSSKYSSTKIFHCYYCPQWYRMKSYLPQHVKRHLRNGDPKYEIASCGLRVHPAYLDGTVWPRRQTPQKEAYRHKTWNGKKTYPKYNCYYCPVEFRIKPYFVKHVREHLEKGHPKFEVIDPNTGQKVHPAYLDCRKTILPVNNGKQPHNNPNKKIYSCHLCNYKTIHMGPFKGHLKRHAKNARLPDTLTCFHCGWSCKWKHKLEVHMRRHFTGSFQCTVCAHRTHTEEQLKLHMRKHSKEKPFACHLCDERFVHHYLLKKHLCTHKFRNNRCPHCEFSASKVRALMEHVMSVHAGPKYYKCPDCEFEASEVPSLRAHALTMHFKKLAKVKCRFCDVEVASSQTLIKHERSHTMPEGYACEECAFVTKFKTGLVAHKLTHTGEKPHKCDLCEYRSTSRSGVSRHMVTHSDVRAFECSLCDAGKRSAFKTKQTLRLHQEAVHSPRTEVFPCATCGHESPSLSALKTHVRIHSNDKPFACAECDYRSRYSGALAKHMKRSHPSERSLRSHKCDFCDFRAVNAVGVSTHMIYTHPTEKPYACDYCGTTFKLKPELIDHEREHTGEKKKPRRSGLVYRRFHCRFCDFECIPFKKIKAHYEESHPDKLETEIIPELAERELQYPAVRKRPGKTIRKCRFCSFGSTIRRKVRIHEQTHVHQMLKM